MTKVEPEPKINNFGSATLLKIAMFSMSNIGERTHITGTVAYNKAFLENTCI